ncbi:hypothetical protein GCM10017673_32580 [Streptosporangium violaceochromogenes]|nr:hypothetical protein GCM10017673_32580 [Streptosporangium violaceochromogenes]
MIALAERRARARAGRDDAGADALRDRIEAEGWLVRDAGDGFELLPRPSFTVWPTVGSIPVPGRIGRGRPGDGPTGRRDQAGHREQTDGDQADDEQAGTRGTGGGEERATSPDPGRVARAAEPSRSPGRLGDLDADRVAETEAAPAQRPEGSELAGRSEGDRGDEGDPQRMISSQLLWDASLAVSRLDEEITPLQAEEPPAPPPVTVGLVVDGRPDDVRRCVRALVAHTEAKIAALDLGNVDGAGAVLEELAAEHPRRVKVWHVAETPHWRGGSAGWGESRTTLLELDTSEVHVVMETSTIMDGDAITPLLEALEGDVVAAGWKGMNPGEDGREWHEAGPGEVRGVLGHLFAVRREAALAAGGFSRDARYYRNADLEFSLRLPGTVVALGEDLPVHREPHRDHRDVDPAYHDAESRRTCDRVLGLLRAT